MGIKFTVPRSLSGVTYTLSTDSVSLSSTEQKALPASCPWSTQVSGPWGITRTTASKATADEKAYLTHVGDYYYNRSYPQAGCEDSANAIKALDTAYKDLFSSLATN